MSEIIRLDVREEWAHAGIIKAGDFCFLSYCVGNIGGTIDAQINGAFDEMERRLALVGLTLENVVQMDCLFRDVWNIPVMEKITSQNVAVRNGMTAADCWTKHYRGVDMPHKRFVVLP